MCGVQEVKFLFGLPPKVIFKNHNSMYYETITDFPFVDTVHAPGVELRLNSTPMAGPLWERSKSPTVLVSWSGSLGQLVVE